MRIRPEKLIRLFHPLPAALLICFVLCLSGAEQARAASQPELAKEVVALVNKERKAAGLPALSMDAQLSQMAYIRAQELEKNFSHTRPDGRGSVTVLKDHGYDYRTYAENIAWGQTRLNTPQKVMDVWMNSTCHRANIMDKKLQKIGVGVHKNAKGALYWVQVFATPK